MIEKSDFPEESELVPANSSCLSPSDKYARETESDVVSRSDERNDAYPSASMHEPLTSTDRESDLRHGTDANDLSDECTDLDPRVLNGRSAEHRETNTGRTSADDVEEKPTELQMLMLNMTSAEAAKALQLKTNAFRNFCRKRNIRKWPNNKLKALMAHVETYRVALQNAPRAFLKDYYSNFIHHYIRLIAEVIKNPNVKVDAPRVLSRRSEYDPQTHGKRKRRSNTTYYMPTGWVAECHSCGKLGKYRPVSEGRPFQHSIGGGQYCGYFKNNPQRVFSGEQTQLENEEFLMDLSDHIGSGAAAPAHQLDGIGADEKTAVNSFRDYTYGSAGGSYIAATDVNASSFFKPTGNDTMNYMFQAGMMGSYMRQTVAPPLLGYPGERLTPQFSGVFPLLLPDARNRFMSPFPAPSMVLGKHSGHPSLEGSDNFISPGHVGAQQIPMDKGGNCNSVVSTDEG